VIFILGSERLYSDLSRKYANRAEEPIHVVRLDKSGGCVDRDEAYMKQLRQAQIRAYFFGYGGENSLAPNSLTADFDDLNIFRIIDGELGQVSCVNQANWYPASENMSFQPGDDDDDVYGSGKEIYEKVTPSSLIQNSLLAVTTASANERQEVIRDSSVRGYIYVADVDEAKKKVQMPSNAMVFGNFPEDVPGLVS
jgi:polyribonucleotide 5'-hydroxyl-kinase